MKKSLKIIVSAMISLVLVISFNYIYQKYINKDVREVYISIANIPRGSQMSNANVKKIKIKGDNTGIELFFDSRNNLDGFFASKNINVGQIINDSMLSMDNEILSIEDNMQYIAIPIENATDAMAYKIKKGDIVDIYYTAKSEQVNNVITSMNKQTVYSNNDDGYVTCQVFEQLEVCAVYNNMGVETSKENHLYTEIIVRVSKNMAMNVINLKVQGTFTLALAR